MKLVAFFSVAVSAWGTDYYPPSDAKGGWRNLPKAEALQKLTGMDAAKLDAAFEYTKDTTQHGGPLVVRHGYLVK